MGALSLASGNGVYFRLKPAITEGLTALGMAVLLFLPEALLKEYFGRQLKGVEFGAEAMKALKKNLVVILGVLFVHAGLTAWAAFAATAAAWGFVSGGLLYILLAAVFLWRIVAARRSSRSSPTRRRTGTSALGWSLVLFDESGMILAARAERDSALPWNNPLRGKADSLEELRQKMSEGLSGLGFPRAASGALVPRPLCIADGRGGLAAECRPGEDSPGMPAAFDLSTLFGSQRLLPPDSCAVFAAVVPRELAPKGLDPTLMRFWALSDLLALRGTTLLSADLSNLAGSLAYFRDSLRNRAPDL